MLSNLQCPGVFVLHPETLPLCSFILVCNPSCPHGITLHTDVMKILLNHSCLAKQLALPLASFVQPEKLQDLCWASFKLKCCTQSHIQNKMQDTNKLVRF